MKIGFWEIVIVLIVALIVIGPDKMPEYMRSLGKGLVQLKGATSEMTASLQEDVIKPLNEAAKPLREAVEPLQDTVATISDRVNTAKKTLNEVQHPVESAKKRAAEKAREEKKHDDSWTCPECGTKVNGNFCSNCGHKKDEAMEAVTETVNETVTEEAVTEGETL